MSPSSTDKTVHLPPSKSVSHRAFILAALNTGTSLVGSFLDADDTRITRDALAVLGADITQNGQNMHFTAPIGQCRSEKIFLGNSGSSARFLIPLASYTSAPVYFYGESRLHERPFQELFTALKEVGGKYEAPNGALPAKLYPAELKGGCLQFEHLPSSQIITSMMLAALWMTSDLTLTLPENTPSLPYIRMTWQLLQRLGINVTYDKRTINIPAGKPNLDWYFDVERDLSAASYWVLFGLINGTKVTLPGITLPSLQGDEKIFEIAEMVGAKIMLYTDRLEMEGQIEKGLIMDCRDIPDLVPALAVMGMFAPEPFRLMHIKHLEYKESNRVEAIQKNIAALGGESVYENDHLTIKPGHSYHPALINTYNDHRIAMSFGVAGTRIEGIKIDNPACVAKSYPEFWLDLNGQKKTGGN